MGRTESVPPLIGLGEDDALVGFFAGEDALAGEGHFLEGDAADGDLEVFLDFGFDFGGAVPVGEGEAAGALLVGTNPLCPLDEQYIGFCQLLADQLSSAMASEDANLVRRRPGSPCVTADWTGRRPPARCRRRPRRARRRRPRRASGARQESHASP